MSKRQPYQLEYIAFQKFLKGQPIGVKTTIILIFKSFFTLIEGLIRNIPGVIGFKLRYYYYKTAMKKVGKNVLIDVGVIISGSKNISIDEFTWIDSNCILSAMLGEITIGKRIHVAPQCIIAARDKIILEDYVGLSSAVRIYSNTEAPIDGKRMSGPMIPEEMKAFKSAPVTLRKDSFVGSGSVILPGVELGEGAVVGANSVVTKSVEPYVIAAGAPAKAIGRRAPVTMPEI